MPLNPQDLLPLGIAAIVNIVITILFCRSLIKTLSFIRSENKTIQPAIIWLLIVPVINYIVNFIVVFGMSKSIAEELKSRDFEEEERPAFSSGLAFAILSLASLAVVLFPIPSSLTVLVAVVGFSQIFFFVQYWMKIIWYKNILEKDETGDMEEKE